MEIKDLLPCIADPSKFRVIGRIDVENLKEVFLILPECSQTRATTRRMDGETLIGLLSAAGFEFEI